MSRNRSRGLACILSATLLSAAALAKSPGTLMPLPRDDARVLVITGASYARGWGTPDLPGYDRVLNRGVGGDRTGEVAARFQTDVIALRPQAVLIWGHVNNITRARPEDRPAAKQAARDDYAAMLRRARAAGIEVIIATEIPWTEAGGLIATLRAFIGKLRGRTSYASRITAEVREVNDYLRQLAAREGCRLLDFERRFAREDGTRRPEYAAADGSHVSQAGYDALTAYAVSELGRGT